MCFGLSAKYYYYENICIHFIFVVALSGVKVRLGVPVDVLFHHTNSPYCALNSYPIFHNILACTSDISDPQYIVSLGHLRAIFLIFYFTKKVGIVQWIGLWKQN